MKKIIFILGMLFSLALSSILFAGTQDFILINKTGIDIHSVYIAPSEADDWGDDVMEADILAAGESVEIVFSSAEDADVWDIRVEDGSGEALEWQGFDLNTISKIVLMENGEAQYE